MKKITGMIVASMCLVGLAVATISAQTNKMIRPVAVTRAQSKRLIHKPIRVKTDQQTVIEGNVSKGTQISYDFTAKDATKISIKLIGKNADFQIGVVDLEEPMRVTNWIKLYDGELYPSDDGQFSIVVRSTLGAAPFQLVILVK